MNKTMVVSKDAQTEKAIRYMKCEVLKEFEKICPTDMSFQRMKKTIHDIFDEGQRQLDN